MSEASMRTGAVVVAAIWLAALPAAGGEKAPAPEGEPTAKVVLTENCYWRQHFVNGMMRISADALRKEGTKWCSPRLLERMERDTKRHLETHDVDWSQTDWKDAAVWFQPRDIAEGALPVVPTVYPPADWTKPGFDDSGWVRQRITALPFQRRAQTFADMYNRMICLRTTFLVPEAGKVKELTLSLAYRGGVRVFVNGTEVARGHLPAGDIAPQAKAEDYPEEAYRAFLDEVPEPNKGRRCIPDLRLPFEDSPKPQTGDKKYEPFRDGFRMLLNKKAWERIGKLRDRQLEGVTIPGRLLRKGTNVLAIAVHGSHYHPIVVPGAGNGRFYADNWAAHGAFSNLAWAHCRLIRLELRDPSGTLPSVLARPEGVQAWVEDMHVRCYPSDYNQAGSPVGVVRMVGGRNGHYSGQILVGTTRALAGLKATAGELARAGGGAIPASAVKLRYMVGEPLKDLCKLGYGRGFGCSPVNYMSVDTVLYVSNDPALRRGGRGEQMMEEIGKVRFFDHITDRPPETVPANSSVPVWVSVKVPEAAPAGKYTGSVCVEARGMEPVTVPLELEVLAWRVPDPGDFQTDVFFEPGPYGIAKQYKVRHWSDEHFRLIDSSFALLGRVGGDVVYVPILVNSEFGNRDHPTLIKWIRRKDGSFAFDYTNLDRYLDIACKRLGGGSGPVCISFQVMHNMMASPKPEVLVHDEAEGKTVRLDLGWQTNPFDRIPIWKAFADSLVSHMKRKGLYDRMYWGHAGDPENDPALIHLLRQWYPDIYWTARTHSYGGGAGGGGHDRAVFRAVSEIYAKGYSPTSRRGWLFRQLGQHDRYHNPLAPRQESAGMDLPFSYRLLVDRAAHLGYTGMGGMGFDYFDFAWHDGYTGADWCAAGIPCFMIAWPGTDRVEPSARLEAFVEGLQDAELRIFLEQARHRKLLPPELQQPADRAVFERYRGGLCNRFRDSALAINTYGWMDRNRQVYAAAATAAEEIALDVDFSEMRVRVPALGAKRLLVKVRNWTGRPRAWKAAGSEPWIVPAATEGKTLGQHDLAVTVDGASCRAGAKLSGTLTVTDAASGRGHPVRIAAEVTPAMELLYDHPNFNVAAGESETREFRVVNHAASAQPWRLATDAPDLRIVPGEGKLGPGESVFVKLTAGPKDKGPAQHACRLTFTGAGGAVRHDLPGRTFVIPTYRDPGGLPFGRVIKLSKLEKKRIVRHQSLMVGDFVIHGRRPKGETSPLLKHEWKGVFPIFGRKRFDRALWVMPWHETVFDVAGGEFTAFSATVGVPVDVRTKMIRQHERRVNFEIWVDGKVRVQSGMMTSVDRGRLLVVEGLEQAAELKLLTRLDSCGDNSTFLCAWANPTFYGK